MDSDIFQTIMQILQSVLVASVQTVSPVHLQLALGHLLGLLDLVLRQLHGLRRVRVLLVVVLLTGGLGLLVLISLLLIVSV